MRGLVRPLLVLSLAVGLAAGVILLERSYRPRTAGGFAQVLLERSDHALNDEDAEAAFGGGSAGTVRAAAPGQSEAGPAPGSSAVRNTGSAGLHGGVAPTTPPLLRAVPGSSGSRAGRSPPPGRLAVQPAVGYMSPDVEQPAANRPTELRVVVDPAGGSGPGGQGVLPVGLVEDSAHRSPPQALGGLRRADLFDLVRQLRADDARTVAAARAELLRRGLTEVDLELGRRLFDPNPDVRRQLVRALPALQSVDPAPWLLRLCQDEDPEVRMAAMALAGTTGDPQLLDQVEAIARQDADNRIRDLADQLATQRDIVGTRAGGAERRQPRTARGPGNGMN